MAPWCDAEGSKRLAGGTMIGLDSLLYNMQVAR